MEDKTYQENDEDSFYDEADTVTSDNDDNNEEHTDSEGEGDGKEEEDYFTLTKSELDERERAIRKEQDKRWKERLKKAGGEEGDSKASRQKEGSKESQEVGDALLARLESRGVLEAEDQEYVLRAAKIEGISPIEALNSDLVKDRLAANKKAREQKQATPSSSRRTSQPRPDDVTYWAQQLTEKGKQAPTAEMRRKVRKYLAQ